MKLAPHEKYTPHGLMAAALNVCDASHWQTLEYSPSLQTYGHMLIALHRIFGRDVADRVSDQDLAEILKLAIRWREQDAAK